MKNTRKLFASLRNLQKEVDKNINSLNYGGCGVFAYLVGEKLQELGLFVEVVTPCDGYGEPANNVRKHVKNANNYEEWDDNGLSRQHLAIRFKSFSGVTYTYDSDALTKSDKYFGEPGYITNPEIGSGLTVEETKAISIVRGGWNSSFNRAQIPLLQKIVNKHFSACI